jgi:hypothetical protein
VREPIKVCWSGREKKRKKKKERKKQSLYKQKRASEAGQFVSGL